MTSRLAATSANPRPTPGHGGSFVRRLDGEFALALFDFQRRELILARERSVGPR